MLLFSVMINSLDSSNYIDRESINTASNIMLKVEAILSNLGKFASLLYHCEGFTTLNTMPVDKYLSMLQKYREI